MLCVCSSREFRQKKADAARETFKRRMLFPKQSDGKDGFVEAGLRERVLPASR